MAISLSGREGGQAVTALGPCQCPSNWLLWTSTLALTAQVPLPGNIFWLLLYRKSGIFLPSAKQWDRLYGSRLERELDASTPARSPAKMGYAVRTKDSPLWRPLIRCHLTLSGKVSFWLSWKTVTPKMNSYDTGGHTLLPGQSVHTIENWTHRTKRLQPSFSLPPCP